MSRGVDNRDTETRLHDNAPPVLGRFEPDAVERWRLHGHDLLRRVTWEAGRGFDLTEEMRATIAANAALVVAGFDPKLRPFEHVTAIIVNRGSIRQPRRRYHDHGGIVSGGPLVASGLAYGGRGPVALDWSAVERDLRRPERGRNVVVHEFAHKLDFLTGDADGIPPLGDEEAEAAWVQILGTNFRRLRRRGSDGLVDPYGATNQAEYFATVSEAYFTIPDRLRAGLPRVFDALSSFYRLDLLSQDTVEPPEVPHKT